jgi:hypothetical protein
VAGIAFSAGCSVVRRSGRVAFYWLKLEKQREEFEEQSSSFIFSATMLKA